MGCAQSAPRVDPVRTEAPAACAATFASASTVACTTTFAGVATISAIGTDTGLTCIATSTVGASRTS